MSDRVFIDTNILVYLYDEDEAEKQNLARAEMERLAAMVILVVSTQVLQEFYVTVTRKLHRPLAPAEARAAVEDLTKLQVVQIDSPMILRAIDLSRDHQVSLWDALILQSAHESSCQTVLTEDLQDGWQVLGLQIRNPLTSSR